MVLFQVYGAAAAGSSQSGAGRSSPGTTKNTDWDRSFTNHIHYLRSDFHLSKLLPICNMAPTNIGPLTFNFCTINSIRPFWGMGSYHRLMTCHRLLLA